MDGDSKGLVAAAKQSKDVSKKLFETIGSEAERLKQTSAETAKEIGKIIPTDLPKKAEQVKGELGELGSELLDVATVAKNTGAEIGNIIPKNASERAATLIKSLNETTEIIKSTGTSVVGASDSFEKFGVDSVRSLNLLKANLATAKTKLDEFSKTNAAPENIVKAQQQIDALEIERIYALQQYHGSEVGQKLYEQALEIARNCKAPYLWLGVWKENSRAIRFYQKQGFIEFGQHIFQLGDDAQRDVLMKKTLPDLFKK